MVSGEDRMVGVRMNLSDWLDSPEGEDAVERAALAIGDDTYAGNGKRTEEGMVWLRRYAKAALRSFLAPIEERCLTCGGTDNVLVDTEWDCPDCSDGVVLGPAPFDALLMKRLGLAAYAATDGSGVQFAGAVDKQFIPVGWEHLYRLRVTKEAQ